MLAFQLRAVTRRAVLAVRCAASRDLRLCENRELRGRRLTDTDGLPRSQHNGTPAKDRGTSHSCHGDHPRVMEIASEGCDERHCSRWPPCRNADLAAPRAEA
jgi:hypothetical protein